MSDLAARRALAVAAHGRLVDAVDAALGDRLRTAPGSRADPYREGVVVSSFGLLERCARLAANPADDFSESVWTARRRVALAALRRLGDGASGATDVTAAVDEVLTERTDVSRGLADWLESLDRPGRAAVAAAAVTWAESVLRLVGPDASIRWADVAASSHWDLPGRQVRLTASHDASLGGVVSGERLLLVADGDGGPADRLRAAHLALVRTLGARRAPVRVSLAAPSRGDLQRVDVDEALLSLAVDRATEQIVVRADPATAPPTPGRWCTRCHLLELCDEGRVHLSATSVDPPDRPTEAT